MKEIIYWHSSHLEHKTVHYQYSWHNGGPRIFALSFGFTQVRFDFADDVISLYEVG